MLVSRQVMFIRHLQQQKALTVKEIAKAAKISEEETLLGMGWLFKEGKITTAEGKVALI